VAALVGQQRIRDSTLFRESGEHLHTVVTDAKDRHSRILQVASGFLKLVELQEVQDG
jgi:hypothetical protein